MMKRLTYRDGNGRAYLNGSLDECAERLATYEELDLLPAELKVLDKLYQEKCEELAALETLINSDETIESRITKAWKEHIVGRFTRME